MEKFASHLPGRTALIGSAVVLAILFALLRVAAAGADEIAYVCAYDICTIDPDEPATHADLTETEKTENQPAWSPDGTEILFHAQYQPDLTRGVYVLKTAEPEEVTDIIGTTPELAGGEAVWSPDGSEIAFAGEKPFDNNANIYISPASGASAPRAVAATATAESEPAWSPDGSTIAFAKSAATYLVSATEASPTAHVLPGVAGVEPTWSPDGTKIAINGVNDPNPVQIVDANSDGNFQTEPVPSVFGFAVAWSPNSQEIAYEGEGPSGASEVRIAPTDPVGPGFTIKLPSGVIVPHHITFSPDGSRVAFSAEDGNNGYENRIYMAAAMPGAEAVVVSPTANESDLEPVWKPGPGGSTGGGGSSGGGSSGAGSGGGSTSGGGGTPPLTREVVTLKLAVFRHPAIVGVELSGGSITCVVGNYVSSSPACHGNGEATYVAPITSPRLAGRLGRPAAKKIVFAKGSVTVPEGKTLPLPLKITGPGKKLLKPGKKLKLAIKVVETAPGAKTKTTTKTVTVTVPKKKH